MNQIRIYDKVFRKDIGYDRISEAVRRLAAGVMADYSHKEPLFLCVLNGAFMFVGDFMKEYTTPCQLSFIKLSSYRGTSSTEEVKTLIGLQEDIKGRDVIILEDIIDTGITISQLLSDLQAYSPGSIRVVTLLLKPEALKTDIRPDYVGIEIPNDFIVGYGLDYEGYGRNSRDIFKIEEED